MRKLCLGVGFVHVPLDTNAKFEDALERTDVAFSYDGAFIGLHVVF
jgi:hypothetical protein